MILYRNIIPFLRQNVNKNQRKKNIPPNNCLFHETRRKKFSNLPICGYITQRAARLVETPLTPALNAARMSSFSSIIPPAMRGVFICRDKFFQVCIKHLGILNEKRNLFHFHKDPFLNKCVTIQKTDCYHIIHHWGQFFDLSASDLHI